MAYAATENPRPLEVRFPGGYAVKLLDNNATRSHLLRRGKIKKAVLDVLPKTEIVDVVHRAVESAAPNLLLVVEECLRKGEAPMLLAIQVDSGPLIDIFETSFDGMIWLLADKGNDSKEMIFKTIFGAKRENHDILLGKAPRNFSSKCSIKVGEFFCPRHHHRYLNTSHPLSSVLIETYPCPGCPACQFECRACRQAGARIHDES